MRRRFLNSTATLEVIAVSMAGPDPTIGLNTASPARESLVLTAQQPAAAPSGAKRSQLHAVAAEGQSAQALARRGENGIGNGGCNRRYGRFTDATDLFAGAFQNFHVDLRALIHPHHRTGVEIGLLHAAMFDRDLPKG